MDKINFQDGTKTSSAKVTIDEVDYPVTPARYSGATPLSANVMNTMQTNIENAINQNADNIGGEEYDETATYEEGDIVKYEGQLYICIEAINTPEEWDSTKWNATDVLSSAGGNEVAIGTNADITGKTKIFIDESEGTDAYSEVVNSLAGDEIAKAPSVRAVKEELNVYSTEETIIGTYKGKPLYRRIFEFGALPDTGQKYVDVLDNTCVIRKYYGITTSTAGTSTYPIPCVKVDNGTPSIELSSFITSNKHRIIIRTTTNLSAFTNTDITIEYTKTTD